MPASPRPQLSAEVLGQWLQHAPGFVAMLSGKSFVIEYVNDAYTTLVSRSVDDLVGRPLFEAVPEASGQGFEQLLASVWTRGAPYVGRGLKVALRKSSGELGDFYLDLVYQPVYDGRGSMTGMFVQGHDVTERHLAHQALVDADRNKDIFLSKLAHELRGPLGAVRSAIEVLKRSPEYRVLLPNRAAAIIDRQTKSMEGLVEELLDLASIRLGKVTLTGVEQIVLQDLVQAEIDALTPQLDAKTQGLTVRMCESPVCVEGDAGKLSRVFANLLANACKYTPAGGEIQVWVDADTEAVLTVKDNGHGMSPQVLDQVFGLFYREEDHPSKRQAGGLGIGLALARQLVELHGGRIEGRSEGPGKGATFVVRLPLSSIGLGQTDSLLFANYQPEAASGQQPCV